MRYRSQVINSFFSALIVGGIINLANAKIKKFAFDALHIKLGDVGMLVIAVILFFILCGVVYVAEEVIKNVQHWRTERRLRRNLEQQQLIEQQVRMYLESRNNLNG